jgi:uncharacterized protein (TIGR03086 family)
MTTELGESFPEPPAAKTTDLPSDPRVILGRALATAEATIAAVTPDQLGDPTPCSEMDVRAMIGHLVGVLDRIAALGRGDDPFAVTELPIGDDDGVAIWAAAVERIENAWRDDAVLDRPMALPWIQGTGAVVLASYFNEITVHTWDLAVASGQQPDWDDVVVEASLAAGDFLPAENRLATFEAVADAMGLDEVPVPFAEVVEVADDAPAIDRLVAWNGRRPTNPLS